MLNEIMKEAKDGISHLFTEDGRKAQLRGVRNLLLNLWHYELTVEGVDSVYVLTECDLKKIIQEG